MGRAPDQAFACTDATKKRRKTKGSECTVGYSGERRVPLMSAADGRGDLLSPRRAGSAISAIDHAGDGAPLPFWTNSRRCASFVRALA